MIFENHVYSPHMQDFYDCLCDEESRFVYQQYIKMLTGDWENPISEARVNLFLGSLKCALQRSKEYQNDSDLGRVVHDSFVMCMLDYKVSYFKLFIFGAGKWGGVLAKTLLMYGIDICGFIDTDESKQGRRFLDKPVISPAEFSGDRIDSAVLIGSFAYEAEIYDYLLQSGIANRVAAIYNIENLYEIAYFGTNFLKPTNNGTYLDVGCYNGYTITQYANWCQRNNVNYKKIIGLEANPRRVHIITSDTAHLPNVEILPFAAYSNEQTLTFSIGKSDMAYIDSSFASSHDSSFNGSTEIELTMNAKRIDSIASEPVSFIKMDIEGSEYEALLGARQTICQYKPTLAISIYHKYRDIIEIPQLIREYEPDYRFYLRHHSAHIYETILYAIKE